MLDTIAVAPGVRCDKYDWGYNYTGKMEALIAGGFAYKVRRILAME